MGGREVWPARCRLLAHVLLLSLATVNASKVLDEVLTPVDAELGPSHQSYPEGSDDEDFGWSAEGSADIEEGSTTGIPSEIPTTTDNKTVYYRVLVNFTNSIKFNPQLEDFESEAFREISEGIIDTLESELYGISGDQSVTVVLIREVDHNVVVELDVGSARNSNDAEIRDVVYSVVRSGSIGPYEATVEGFSFRHLGQAVDPSFRPCHADEFTCGSGECIPFNYRCDLRADCSDMSDEDDCDDLLSTVATSPTIQPIEAETTTITFVDSRLGWRKPVPLVTPAPGPGPTPVTADVLRPCPVDKAVCQNGQCIPRDYLCDGERDCTDGSDELDCGTPSPCEPNEFKCKNGRCALKLWRCDGDNDCGDDSDEEYCPTKGPGDTCAPEQFVCVSNRLCIPASYQCDEEADCPDRSDEFGCTPPQVVTPPEETVMVKRGATVVLTCVAAGVPTPIITWRLNWGHIPLTSRVTMTSQNGQGTLVIRDVKESDQGAYTCEAINARGMIFAIPDALLMLKSNPGLCPEGQFNVEGTLRCIPCFCSGLTRNCVPTSRYRNQIRLRFTEEDNFMGVNVTVPAPSQPPLPPLTNSQMIVDPVKGEFQLVDLSRRFLNQESFWILPKQFLGNKVDSYGGHLRYKVRYSVPSGQVEHGGRLDVIITGNGRKLVYKMKRPTYPSVINQRDIIFTEDMWQQESGTPVTREDLMMTLANLDSILIQTKYDNRMASVGLSDIVMDTTSVEVTNLGKPLVVEECRCPQSYVGLSCETCASGFNRVPNGQYLGVCDGCSCNGHASTCDKVTGYCLNCQHNTEGPQCDKCKAGFFGNPTGGTPGDCKPCPCPHTSANRRFSETCFVDTDKRPTCDACRKGYSGRRCETCAAGYTGDPMKPGGKCTPTAGEITKCDSKGTDPTQPSDGYCVCKPNVVGRFCAECSAGSFNLDDSNVDGCLKCFCMGNSKECASSSWHRDQVQGALDEQERGLYMLTNMANTHRITEGIRISASNELIFTNFATIPRDIYYWILPKRFKGDKVTSYGGKMQYTILQKSSYGSSVVTGLPDVILQGNNIFLEHYTRRPEHGVPTTITIHFKETEWRRADGHPSTREHLLMALADISLFMIRGSYSEGATESRISQIRMDVAVPHSTGQEKAVEVEECVCPKGYKGTSCQECDIGYTRTTSGLYLGTCERCECNGHSDCDVDTGECQKCQHNTQGQKCDQCKLGFYGDAKGGKPDDCQPCPCPGTTPSNQFSETCFVGTDGKPTCNNCPSGFGGRNCERNLTEFCKAWIQPEIRESEELIPADCKKIVHGGMGVAGNATKPGDQRHKGKPGTPSKSKNTTVDVEKFGNTSTPDAGTKLRNTTNKSRRTLNFRHLMKTSITSFNRRLVMLEGNGLDLKDGFKRLQKRQDDLSLQLKNLSHMLSAPPKDRLISQLQGKYTEVSGKLTALQVRLEILIDGFAALAEEVSELRKKKTFRTNSDQPNLSNIATSSPANPFTKRPKMNFKTNLKLKPTSNGDNNGSLKFVSTKPPAKAPSPNATGQKKGKKFQFPKKPTAPIHPLPTLRTHVLTTASPKRSMNRIQANRKLKDSANDRTKPKFLPAKKAPRADVSTVDVSSFSLDLVPSAFTVTPDGASTQATRTVRGKPMKSFPGVSSEKVKIVNVKTVARTEAPARGKGGTNSSLKTRADFTGKTKPSRSLTKVKVKPDKKITAQPKDKAKRGSKTATQSLNTSVKPSGNRGGSQTHKIKHPGSDAASTHWKRKTFLRSDVTTLSPFIKLTEFAGKRPLPTSAPAKKVSGKRRTQLKIATDNLVNAQSLKRSDVQPVIGAHGKPCANDDTPRRKNTGGREKKTKKATALDILQLLKGGNHYSNANKKLKDVPLYITLGRLAIPIKIIPD